MRCRFPGDWKLERGCLFRDRPEWPSWYAFLFSSFLTFGAGNRVSLVYHTCSQGRRAN
jgi:hypothetical protein